MLELYMVVSGGIGKGERSQRLSASRVFAPLNAALGRRASWLLHRIATRVEPQLSADAAIERATTRSLEALDRFVRARTG